MPVVVDTDPTQHLTAICDKCGAREGPVLGGREEALRELARRAWRVDERFTKAAICAKCAGPPSVFPAARVTGNPPRCSACEAGVERCDACHVELRENDVISCRRARGHAHARCSTHKMRRFTPPA